MKQLSESVASHIIGVYNEMEEKSEMVGEYRVYKGSLNRLVKELGISMTYYSIIFRVLYDGGYIDQVDRGGRDKPSTIVLHHAPKMDELLLTSADLPATVPLVQRIEKIERSLGGMNIVDALSVLDSRLSALEGRKHG